MARISKEQLLVPTLLDRLLNEGPSGSASTRGDGFTLRGLKEGVRRDLENLLNTRRRWVPWPAEYEELDKSLYSYGIPDFTGMNASSTDDVHQFLRTIESVIRRFEPRFKSVRVILPNNIGEEDRSLRFRIEGMLHAEPAPEPATFDTEMKAGTGTFEVESAD
jgi:type VI secretion system protein ImpF